MVEPVPFVRKIFTLDPPSRQALPLLSPSLRAADLAPLMPAEIGPRIGDLGERLYREGSLPGIKTDWETERSPEIERSIAAWRLACTEASSRAYTVALRTTFKEAQAGLLQMGRLEPKLAALRWCLCIKWLSARAELIDLNSSGGHIGGIDAKANAASQRETKEWIMEECRTLTGITEVLAMVDYDICGEGVWVNGGREPLPKLAKNDWYRRGVEFYIASLCLQVSRLPPTSINNIGFGPPVYCLKRPYGELEWRLQPALSSRVVVEAHAWTASVEPSPINTLKALVMGGVLHMEAPPPPVFDVTDPEIYAKVQRGEDLGKGTQADGLPGAAHGSIGLAYASLCATEEIENVRFHPEILKVDGLIDSFLRSCPPLRTLDFQGCAETMTQETLLLLPLAGPSLLRLDLEACGLGRKHVDMLVHAFARLPGLQFVDLGENKFDDKAALQLTSSLCRSLPDSEWDFGRVDVATVRFDGNPLQDPDAFRSRVAALLEERGGTVVAGGELILHQDNLCITWKPGPNDGSSVSRLMDDSAPIASWVKLNEFEKRANKSNRELDSQTLEDEFVARTPAYLAARVKNAAILDHPFIKMMKAERAAKAMPDAGD